MTDREIKFQALNYWANYIETGDIVCSPSDLARAGKTESIKTINVAQREFVKRLRELANKELE